MYRTTYLRYETGEIEIPVSALKILAKKYKTSIDFLVGRTDIKTPIEILAKGVVNEVS